MWTDEDAEAAKPVVGNESAKTLRDRENTRCVGGLRAPWRAVQKINNLRSAGRRVRAVIEKFIDDNDGVLGLWDRLGRADTEGTDEVLLDELRCRLGVVLQADALAKAHSRCSWRVGIVEGFNRLSGDPEVFLPLWLREGAPIGVKNRIPACGIFPRIERPSLAEEELKHFYAEAIPQQNYKSMREHSEKVMAELDREVAAGFTTKFDDWEAVKATWSEVLVSKLAAIVKTRNDGSERVRIIIDMLRSGLNLFVKLEERIVLPRLRDIIANALWLLSMAENPGQVE